MGFPKAKTHEFLGQMGFHYSIGSRQLKFTIGVSIVKVDQIRRLCTLLILNEMHRSIYPLLDALAYSQRKPLYS